MNSGICSSATAIQWGMVLWQVSKAKSCSQPTNANRCPRHLCSSHRRVHPVHTSAPGVPREIHLCRREALACAVRASKKAVGTIYHAKLARHGQGAQDGSILLYWATWSGWPAFKIVSNLRFLSSLYDAHRLDVNLLDQMCPHIHNALDAQAKSFTSEQASRTILYLSRLHIVPQESLWRILARQVDAQTTLCVNEGINVAAHDKCRENKETYHIRCPQKDGLPESTRKQAIAADVGILHSVSVLRMLAAGGGATNWRVTTSGGLQLHHVPANVCISFSEAFLWPKLDYPRRPASQISSVKQTWSKVPEYLHLPPATMAAAVASWQSLNRHSSVVDGIWLPLQPPTAQPGPATVPDRMRLTESDECTHSKETCQSTSQLGGAGRGKHGRRKRSTAKSSSFERSVVAALQAELDVPLLQEAMLEGSYVSVDVGVVGRGRAWRRGEAVFVAVEAQGPKHFVTKRAVEKRSSAVKRLLRQHAGWHVVAVGHREWRKAGHRGQRQLLRERLKMLPARCWRQVDAHSDTSGSGKTS